MDKKIKSVITFVVTFVLVIIIITGINAYIERKALKMIEGTIYDYFKYNNIHISSHDFSISKARIKCRGNNAYIVEFNLLLDKDEENFSRLAATVYKKGDTWKVKGLGSGLTTKEIKQYNFKCYDL